MSEQDEARSSRDSTRNTLLVAIGVSLVCSILVSSAAIVLRPTQTANETLFRHRIVLQVAGLYEEGVSIDEQFEAIETRMVDLSTGEYVDIDPATFDPEHAANDPEMGVEIPDDEDIARLKRRERYAPVYLVSEGGQIKQVILPIRGKGLWSTLYGYLAVEPDGETVRDIKFYEHAETPGLGDQIDRPAWQAQWQGMQLYDADGNPQIEIVLGQAPADSDYQVDGLSGATMTAKGVQNLVRYWTGADGFKAYLARLGNEASNNG